MLVTPVRAPVEPHARGDDGPDADSHDLRARDMAVRTEQALREHDGSLDLLPSYQYALGPDGRPYAVEPGERIVATRSYTRFAEAQDVPPKLDTIA
jgi:hypothetical protein